MKIKSNLLTILPFVLMTIFAWTSGQEFELHQTLTGHGNLVRSVAFSPDGNTLVSGSGDNAIKLWNVSDGKLLQTFTGHERSVYSVAFSPDGTTLASGSWDKTIKLWNVSDGKLLQTFTDGFKNLTYSIAFSPNGKNLASGCYDKTVKLWNVSDGKLLQSFRAPGFNLDGREGGAVFSIAFSPDGKNLASGSKDETIRLWRVLGGGRYLEFRKTLTGHGGYVGSVAFSPDGKTLASGSDDKTIKLWDVSDGKLLQTFTGHGDNVGSVAFSPDGKTLASGSDDKTIKLWDAWWGKLLHTFTGHGDGVGSVAFSPDRKTLASGSDDKTIKLWVDPVPDLAEQAHPDLFLPQGEFETNAEYAQRVQRQEQAIEQVRQEGIAEQKSNKAEEERLAAERAAEEEPLLQIKIAESLSPAEFAPSDLGRYNAENGTFPLTVGGQAYTVKIPRSEARDFKENYRTAKVEGYKQLQRDLITYDYFNMVIIHPITGTRFPFGPTKDLVVSGNVSLSGGSGDVMDVLTDSQSGVEFDESEMELLLIREHNSKLLSKERRKSKISHFSNPKYMEFSFLNIFSRNLGKYAWLRLPPEEVPKRIEGMVFGIKTGVTFGPGGHIFFDDIPDPVTGSPPANITNIIEPEIIDEQFGGKDYLSYHAWRPIQYIPEKNIMVFVNEAKVNRPTMHLLNLNQGTVELRDMGGKNIHWGKRYTGDCIFSSRFLGKYIILDMQNISRDSHKKINQMKYYDYMNDKELDNIKIQGFLGTPSTGYVEGPFISIEESKNKDVVWVNDDNLWFRVLSGNFFDSESDRWVKFGYVDQDSFNYVYSVTETDKNNKMFKILSDFTSDIKISNANQDFKKLNKELDLIKIKISELSNVVDQGQLESIRELNTEFEDVHNIERLGRTERLALSDKEETAYRARKKELKKKIREIEEDSDVNWLTNRKVSIEKKLNNQNNAKLTKNKATKKINIKNTNEKIVKITDHIKITKSGLAKMYDEYGTVYVFNLNKNGLQERKYGSLQIKNKMLTDEDKQYLAQFDF